jgi:hypothetical protein
MGDFPIIRPPTDIYQSTARVSVLLAHTIGQFCLLLTGVNALTIRWS